MIVLLFGVASMANQHIAAEGWPLELTQLGRALEQQVDALIDRLRTALGNDPENPHGEPLLEDTRSATSAFARWLTTGNPAGCRAAGRDACHSFGRVVASDGISTTDMIRGCQTWRNVVAEVLVEEAQRLARPESALAQARGMLQRSHEVTLLQFAGAFDSERERLHEELRVRESQSPGDP
jgi:hypothetical protein